MRLGPLFAIALWAQAAAAQTTLISDFRWSGPGRDFGGFSGLHIADQGKTMWAVTDSGVLFTADLIRTDGVISGVEITNKSTLKSETGGVMQHWRADAEGLAIAPDGRIYISFEGDHRVLFYASPDSTGAWLPRHPRFRHMPNNSSLEALAIAPNGALYTIPERSTRVGRPFPVYVFDHGGWDIPFRIPRSDGFLVVGADIGPDEKFYLLERSFVGTGFRTRVRRFNLDGTAQETLLETPLRTFQNLEGISVWRDSATRLRMTLISDDNYKPYLKTQIVEYLIND